MNELLYTYYVFLYFTKQGKEWRPGGVAVERRGRAARVGAPGRGSARATAIGCRKAGEGQAISPCLKHGYLQPDYGII